MKTFTLNTRYNQPTGSKGSSITAYLTSGCLNKQLTLAYDYKLSPTENHDITAEKLAIKLFSNDIDTIHSYKETSSKRGYKYSGYIYS
jgi:hypothetical protein